MGSHHHCQDNYAQQASKILRQHGYRNTKQRKHILEILDKQPPNQLVIPHTFIQENPQLDKVTVYRFLDILCSLHLAHKVESLHAFVLTDGKAHNHQHYYLVCGKCKKFRHQVQQDNKDKPITEHLRPYQYGYEIIGLCKQCHQQ